jgi:hypothetical protein
MAGSAARTADAFPSQADRRRPQRPLILGIIAIDDQDLFPAAASSCSGPAQFIACRRAFTQQYLILPVDGGNTAMTLP